MTTLLIVDLSSIAHPLWHGIGKRDPTGLSDLLVGRVAALAEGYDLVAVCCDCPGKPCWRHQAWQGYKASRLPWPELFVHQYRSAFVRLRAIAATYAVAGYEADDLIATVAAWAGTQPAQPMVTVASNDKDLAQLVSARTRLLLTATGEIADIDGVHARWGVWPHQMVDLLTMVGDPSDGVPGLPAIGVKRATELLERFGTLQKAMDTARRVCGAKAAEMSPSVHRSLSETGTWAQMARTLVTLRADAPIDCQRIAQLGNPWSFRADHFR